MPRTLSTTLQNGTQRDDTRPIGLIRMAWATERRVATWDQDISWNSEVWSASGAFIDGPIGPDGGVLVLPNGDGDPWLNLEHTEIARGRAIEVYAHYTDFDASPQAADAEMIFKGIMDEANVTRAGAIEIQLLESRQAKVFPASSILPGTYNHLLPKGMHLQWGDQVIVVN